MEITMDMAPIKTQECLILFIQGALSTLKNVCLAFTPSILVAKIPFQVTQNKPISQQRTLSVLKTMINRLHQLQGSFCTRTFTDLSTIHQASLNSVQANVEILCLNCTS